MNIYDKRKQKKRAGRLQCCGCCRGCDAFQLNDKKEMANATTPWDSMLSFLRMCLGIPVPCRITMILAFHHRHNRPYDLSFLSAGARSSHGPRQQLQINNVVVLCNIVFPLCGHSEAHGRSTSAAGEQSSVPSSWVWKRDEDLPVEEHCHCAR